MPIRTYKIKLKPGNDTYLKNLSSEVNFCWNRLIDSCESYVRSRRFQHGWTPGCDIYLSKFDLMKTVSGFTKVSEEDGNWCQKIMQSSLQLIAQEIAIRSKQFKKYPRKRGPRSRRWIPLKAEQLVRITGNGCTINKKRFRFFEDISNLKIKTASFVEEVDGWYLCVQHEMSVPVLPPAEQAAVGIDLGIKTTATFSDGKSWKSDFYSKMEPKIKDVQRKGLICNKETRRKNHNHLTKKAKNRIARLHQKVARQRDHSMHQVTNYLIKNYQSIFVGDVSDAFLRSGNSAKTAYDSSFYKFKEMLKYKASGTGRHYFLIDEKFTTQACSACGSLCGPQGTSGLVVREWQCKDCGTLHDRDVNAAINICHLGMKQHPPCAGTSRTKIDPPSQQPSRCEAWTRSITGQA